MLFCMLWIVGIYPANAFSGQIWLGRLVCCCMLFILLGWPRESYGISKSMHMIPRIPIYLPSVH